MVSGARIEPEMMPKWHIPFLLCPVWIHFFVSDKFYCVRTQKIHFRGRAANEFKRATLQIVEPYAGQAMDQPYTVYRLARLRRPSSLAAPADSRAPRKAIEWTSVDKDRPEPPVGMYFFVYANCFIVSGHKKSILMGIPYLNSKLGDHVKSSSRAQESNGNDVH